MGKYVFWVSSYYPRRRGVGLEHFKDLGSTAGAQLSLAGMRTIITGARFAALIESCINVWSNTQYTLPQLVEAATAMRLSALGDPATQADLSAVDNTLQDFELFIRCLGPNADPTTFAHLVGLNSRGTGYADTNGRGVCRHQRLSERFTPSVGRTVGSAACSAWRYIIAGTIAHSD